MIVPGNYLMEYIPGVQFDFRFQYMQGGSASNTPVNLTGYTPTWIVTNANGSIYTYGLGSTNSSGVFFGGQTQTPTNGIIDLILTAIATENLPSPSQYQFYLAAPSSTPIPLLYGSLVNANADLYVDSPPPLYIVNGGTAATIDYIQVFDGNPPPALSVINAGGAPTPAYSVILNGGSS